MADQKRSNYDYAMELVMMWGKEEYTRGRYGHAPSDHNPTLVKLAAAMSSLRERPTAAGSAALPPPPPDPVYWQWRHTRDAWSTTFLFTSEPAVTAPDTEKRPLYAGPVIAFGVPPFDASKPCILTTDDPTRTLCLRCMNPHHACDHPAYGGTAAAVPHRESDSIGRTMRMEAVLFSAEAKAAYAAPLPAAAPKSGETPDQRPADGDGVNDA